MKFEYQVFEFHGFFGCLDVRSNQPCFADAKASEARLVQYPQRPGCIARVRPDSEVQIARVPRVTIDRQRVAAHHQIFNLV